MFPGGWWVGRVRRNQCAPSKGKSGRREEFKRGICGSVRAEGSRVPVGVPGDSRAAAWLQDPAGVGLPNGAQGLAGCTSGFCGWHKPMGGLYMVDVCCTRAGECRCAGGSLGSRGGSASCLLGYCLHRNALSRRCSSAGFVWHWAAATVLEEPEQRLRGALKAATAAINFSQGDLSW